jgi:hypothetical protein
MSDPKTRAQLVTRAAQKLLLIGSGQSLESEDAELIDQSVDAVIDDLSGRGVITILDDEAIEPAHFEWLAMCLANAVAENFGQSIDASKVLFAENRLRTLAAQLPTGEPLKAEYF